jgi:hypothetical protein
VAVIAILGAARSPCSRADIPDLVCRFRIRLLAWRAPGKPRAVIKAGLIVSMVMRMSKNAATFFTERGAGRNRFVLICDVDFERRHLSLSVYNAIFQPG